jgi:hydrogenase maturation factor
MMSLAREGNGTLNVQAGGVVAVGNTVFLSLISSAGSATGAGGWVGVHAGCGQP